MRALLVLLVGLCVGCGAAAPPAPMSPGLTPPSFCVEEPSLGGRVTDAWAEGAKVSLCAAQEEEPRCWSVDTAAGRWAEASPRAAARVSEVRVEGSSWALCDAQGCAQVAAPAGARLCSEWALVAFDAAREQVALFYAEDCQEGGSHLALFEVASGRQRWAQRLELSVSEVCPEAVGFLGSSRLWVSRSVCAGPGSSSLIHRADDGAVVAATYGPEYPGEEEVGARFARLPSFLNTYAAWPIEGFGEAWVFWSSDGGRLAVYDPEADQWGASLELAWGESGPQEPEAAALVGLPERRAAMVSATGEVMLIDLSSLEVVGRLSAPRCQGSGESSP